MVFVFAVVFALLVGWATKKAWSAPVIPEKTHVPSDLIEDLPTPVVDEVVDTSPVVVVEPVVVPEVPVPVAVTKKAKITPKKTSKPKTPAKKRNAKKTPK